MIPDEAVEAAAKALYEMDPARNYLDDTLCSWDDLSPFGTGIRRREKERDKARTALEAAAPYMCPPSSQVATQAARLRATLDERLGRGTPQTREGDHE